MMTLLRALSLSYGLRYRIKVLLTILAIAAGVATFASLRAARGALLNSLRLTVDRMAGKAQLQITGVGGIPEELQERVRDVAGIAGVAPVIEEVATLEPAGVGAVLLVGVDLLGDRTMREYGFEGEDDDIDDPLLFLAQPDSVAVTGELARRAGLRPGDAVVARFGPDTRRLVVRAILRRGGFGEAFGGAVVVTDVYSAQTLLGRGRRFDRLDVRLVPDLTADEAQRRLVEAVGAGYRIETPERRGARMERLIANFTAGFDISSFLAIGIAVFLVQNAFTVSVHRRRREIGILRSIGATARQVQGLVLAEATLVGAIGGAAGGLGGMAIAERFLGVMAEAVATGYGLQAPAAVSFASSLLMQSLALGIAASIVGAWLPARVATRIQPVQALAAGTFQARITRPASWSVATGALAAAAATILAVWPPVAGPALVWMVLSAFVLATALLAGPLCQWLLVAGMEPLRRLTPAGARLAIDSLRSHPRQTASTAAAITLALAFTLGLGSYLRSIQEAFERWVGSVMTADLYVRASPGLAPSAARFPWALADRLEAIPGIRSVDGFRNDRVLYEGDEITIAAVDAAGLMARTRQEFTQGTADSALHGLIEAGGCLVSDNLARRRHLRLGDTLAIDGPAGPVALPIAGVVVSFLSDHGAVLVDRSVFARHWGDDRADLFQVTLEPEADPGRVRDTLASMLAGRYPAFVATRVEFVAEMRRALQGFYTLTRITMAMSLVVAFMSVATALLMSVGERTREIGILKAIGAVGRQIRRSVVLEALILAGVALLFALPLGMLLATFLTTTVAEAYAGFRLSTEYPVMLLGVLAGALPVVAALASWLPAHHAAGVPAPEAVAYE